MSLLYRSAFGIATDIKAGKLSAVDVLDFFLARIDALNPALNAVVVVDREGAGERARAADAAAAQGDDWGPLHGVPVTIKDAWCTAGLTTVAGIPARAGEIPAKNAAPVQRYLDAGAIIMGKTNVPFMCADLQTFNEVYGVTNNPWDTGRTCGGSSGGAAAALAAGLTPLELGSDIGGSIRTPSHFNGIYGHKPSFGLVSTLGHVPPGENALRETDLSVAGPMATCVADLEQALELLTKPDEAARTLPVSFGSVQTLRVAVWSNDGFCRVVPEIHAHIQTAADTLAKLGAQVDRRARPDIDPEANHINFTQLMLSALGADMPDSVYQMARQMTDAARPDDMDEPLLQMRGIALSHRDWLAQEEIRLRTRQAWTQFFGDYDVLLCPCAHVLAFPHDHNPDMQARRLLVGGESRPYTEIMRWAGLPLNAYLPATAVPLGTSEEGLPVGMQIVGREGGDRTCLAVAKLLEAHHRGFVPPPGFGQGQAQNA